MSSCRARERPGRARVSSALTRRRRRPAPDVLMVLENCTYPSDSRVRNEAESLLASGRAVEVLAPREPGEAAREVIAGVSVRRLRLLDGRGTLTGTALEYASACLLMGVAILLRIVRSSSGTLHVHNPPDLFFPLLILARWRGWSTVFDHHDDAAGMLRAKLGRSTPLERALVWMRTRSAAASDLTITTNDSQRELVQEAAARVVVVRNNPPAWFSEHCSSPPNGHVRLAFAGEIGEQDRVELAVDVLALLLRQGRVNAELLVIGDGPRRGAVEERASSLGVSDRVQLTGWVAYEQVPVLLSSAHIGLDTAPMTEVNHASTMVKILEYLAVGLPIVASALRETKRSGGDAVIAVEGDDASAFAAALQPLLGSRETWERHASQARARGLENDWSNQARKLLCAYEDLAG